MKRELNRRNFLKLSSVATVYALSNRLLNAADNIDDDYKAIVVIYKGGGNDSLNMFIPSSSDPKTGYSNYANIRNNIKVTDKSLDLLVDGNNELDLSAGNPYAMNNSLVDGYTKGFYRHVDDNGNDLGVATNALMPELAHLINQKQVAIIQNCGNIIQKATKTQLQNKTKPTPPFLYAHNHQTKLAFNGEAEFLDYTGWAGRLYDRWKDVNDGDIYDMNISVGGVTHLFEGNITKPLSINPSGPSKYRNQNKVLYENYLKLSRRDIFKKVYNDIRVHSFSMQDTIVDDWQNNSPDFSSLTNAYGEKLFSKPSNETLSQSSPVFASTSLLRQLEAVAKLAKIGKDRASVKREIFYVFDGGYDTHNNQSQQHARKLRGVSMALGDFYKAIESMGMQNNITTITVSDFARSTGNNGDGSDHAWGGSYFVMGGAVKGGIYGIAPDLTLGSDDDMTKKGRLIPTTSFTQYYATVVKWFGADETTLNDVFPELENFAQKDLGFMK